MTITTAQAGQQTSRDRLTADQPGAYYCRCAECREQFIGYKRDRVCAA